jgi:hypothetical protein
MTETLFNPNYLGLNLHLLAPAYVSALGIGVWWTVFVLTLHTVWSISTSIGLQESLVPSRASTPWLGSVGLIITGILFTLAAVVSSIFAVKQDRNHFVASAPQLTCAALICILVIIVAFRLPKRMAAIVRTPRSAPTPWLAGSAALAAGSAFMTIPKTWAWLAVALYLFLDIAMVTAVYIWSHRAGWNGRHRLALSGGAAVTYGWHAFVQTPAAGNAGHVDRIGNVLFALGLIVLLIIAARRQKSQGIQEVGSRA